MPTPTADRCCHEGRQKPSMARRAKPARAKTSVVWNGHCLGVVAGRTVKIKAGMARRLCGSCCRDRVLI
ncbi:msr2608 [Mesorhizobium japonicum MAFF 303099]|uniref:Msr2608 protein n=1 Tax=Mesorhizobium japonicum (strain LMG 29417 / CECT 9101 / MAFF 303099) TaxID=266835 RepID=Q98I18_RHILO|nr:msr2608 [Mesorhizobium japonicum MAFF 303099]